MGVHKHFHIKVFICEVSVVTKCQRDEPQIDVHVGATANWSTAVL
jgi:hypothetical protein